MGHPYFNALNQAAAVGGGGPADDPPGVSPSDLSGLQLWLKANAITGLADGDQITTVWPDSSGNSRDATAVAAGIPLEKPTYKATSGPNSYPAVQMARSVGGAPGGWFSLPNFLTAYSAGDAFAVFIHDSYPTTNDGAPPCGDWGTAGDSYFTWTNNHRIYDDFGTNSRKDDIIPVSSMAVWGLYEERTAAGAWSCHQNGTQLHSTASNTVAFGSAPYIGHTSVNSKFFQGFIAEIIFFNRVLTSSERFDTIHTYLNNKYALGLPTS